MNEPRYPRLNVGCGKDLRKAWVNLDRKHMGKVSIDKEFCKFDLATIGPRHHGLLPFSHDSFQEIHVSHTLEHLSNPLEVMGELYRVARPDCRLQINIPHGGSDDAWEDQTHLRAYYEGSWVAFSQPYYWRADYGYYGDWQCDEVVLLVEPSLLSTGNLEAAMAMIKRGRNFVYEMIAVLRAVKPARPQEKLSEPGVLNVNLVPLGSSDAPAPGLPPSTPSAHPAIDLSGPASPTSGDETPPSSGEAWDVATRSPS